MFDFDGTLSAIVSDPATATPRAGVVDHLAALTDRYLRVGVISGRPVRFLADVMPGGVYLSGLYGMEEWVDDRVVAPDEFRRWTDTMAGAVADLVAAVAADPDLEGVEVEDKGLSTTLHYRTRPVREAAVLRLARTVADARGLDVRPARMSVEVHPPVPTDKGGVLRRLVAATATAESVMFVGDDVGDLPAFDALADLRAEGLTTLAVAVASSEIDARVRDRADLIIADSDVVELLRVLRFGSEADA